MRTGTSAEFDLDLHLHSRYSISCSKDMGLESLAASASVKGLDGLGTGDCLYPIWLSELEDRLEGRDGSYTFGGTSFILQSEIETLDGGRIHHLLLFPDFEAVHEMRRKLHRLGASDIDNRGRPQVHVGGSELLRIAEECGALCGPAHAFTPYVGIYAHRVSLKNSYGHLPPFLELGLSADTEMASKISELNGVPFLTASDAHSPQPHRLGREFTRFKITRPTFNEVAMALAGRAGRGIVYNVGLDVREGKYHRTGCTGCGHMVEMDDAIRRLRDEGIPRDIDAVEQAINRLKKNRCPQCGGALKLGVRDRISLLSCPQQSKGKNDPRPPYLHVMPLAEGIAGLLGVVSVNAKKVREAYRELISDFGPENKILLDLDPKYMEASSGKYASAELRRMLARFIADFHAERVFFIMEGHGGIYGKLDFGGYAPERL